MINIRASMLPSYNDCPRRAAANQWRPIITEMGFALREVSTSIGAAVGTSCHEAAKLMIECKMQGTQHKMTDIIDAAFSNLHKGTVAGVTLDNTTTSINEAEKQISVLALAFERDVLPSTESVELELQMKARITDDAEFTGRCDTEQVDETIDDWKYGSKMRYYGSQLGGYSILKKSRTGKSAKRVSIYHLPRVSVKKSYPGTARYFYNVESCEVAAFYAIQRIKADIDKFIKTQNPWIFPANPMSMMCSEKYCPAFGTSFCELTERK
jgi:hypothetical protein